MSMFDRLEDTLRRYEDVTAELGNPDIVTDQDKFRKYMKAKSKLSPETQELFSQALRMLWKTGNQTVKKSVKQAVLEKVEEANSLFSNDKSKKSMKSSKK